MKQIHATLLGFALAPLVPACVFAATSPGLTDNNWRTAIAFVPIFYCVAIIPTAVLALPLYLLLKRAGHVTWWSTLTGGAAIGAVFTMAMMQATTVSAFYGAGLGAGTAFVFWAIRRLGRTPADDRLL